MGGSQYDVAVRLSMAGAPEMAGGLRGAADAAFQLGTAGEKAGAGAQRIRDGFAQAVPQAQQLSSGLNGINAILGPLQTAMASTDAGTRRLSTTFRTTTADGDKYSITMRQLAESKKAYIPLVDQVTDRIFKLGTAYEALRIVGGLVADMFGDTKKQEDQITTIAATMSATNGWSNSVGIATGVLMRLKETAALVNGTEDQMVSTFTMLKRTFGGTSDEAVTLTEKLALLSRQSGASIDDLATRLAAASITGKLQMRGAAGIALTGAGVDPQVLMTMKEAGLAMDYLNAKIADNPELVERLMSGWSYLSAEFSKNKTEALELVGVGLDPLKQSVKDLNETMSSEESKRGFETLGSHLKILTGQIADFLHPALADAGGFTSVLDLVLKGLTVDVILIKEKFDIVIETVASAWERLTHPFKYFGNPDALKAEVDRYNAEISRIKVDAAAALVMLTLPTTLPAGLAKNILDTDAGPSEKPTKPAPGRGPDAAALARIAEANIKAANEVQDAWDKAYVATLTGVDKQVAEVDIATQKEIEKFAEAGHSWQQMEDFSVAVTAEGEAKKTAIIQAAAEKSAQALALNMDWYRGEQEKLYDQLTGASDDYYAKQQAAIDKMIDKEQEALDRRLDEGKLEQEQYDKLVDALQLVYDTKTALLDREADSILGVRRKAEEEAKRLVETSDSVSGGIAAGWASAMAKVQSTTESVRDFVLGVWTSIGTGFETGFYDILSGKASDLKNVFKSLWDSILKDFSKMLSEMAMRWLTTGQLMGKGGSGGFLGGILGGGGAGQQAQPGTASDPYGLNQSAPGVVDLSGGGGVSGSGGGLSTGQYASIAGGALMFGAALGGSFGKNSQQTNLSGVTGAPMSTADFGGTATMGPYASAAATLVVGLTAAAVTAVAATGAAVTAASVAAVIPVWGWIAAAVILLVGAIISIANGPKEAKVFAQPGDPAWSQAFGQIGGTSSAGALNTFSASGLSTTIRASYDAGVKTALAAYDQRVASGGGYELHAGSIDDLKKDADNLIKNIIPAEMEHALFGQKATGGLDTAGISGVSSFTNAMIDPSAPIPMMLEALGFTGKEIQKIAGQIDIQGIAAFRTYLTDLVTIVTGFQAAQANLGMTSTQDVAGITAARDVTTASTFQDSATNLTELANELSQYTGQDQIDHAKTLLGLVNQRWADEETAIGKLMDEEQQFHDSVVATLALMTAARTGAAAVAAGRSSADLSLASANAQLYGTQTGLDYGNKGGAGEGLLQKVAYASDADLPALAAQAATLIKSTFDLLITRLQGIYVLQAQNASLLGPTGFGQSPAQMAATAAAVPASANFLTGGQAFSTSIGTMLASAQASSGQEQLDWITKIQNAAAERYQLEIQQIAEIQGNLKTLATSIDQQKFGMSYEIASNPDKAAMLLAKIKADEGAIGQTTNAADLKRLTDEIQSLTGQYWGISDKSQGAAGLLDKLLDETQKAAEAQYAVLSAGITSADDAIRTQLQTVTGLLTQAETDTKTALNGLTTSLKALDTLVHDRLHTSIDQIVASNGGLNDALAAATPLFTGAGAAADRAGQAFDRFAAKLDNWTPRVAPAPAGGNNVIATIRNNPLSLATRTGNGS